MASIYDFLPEGARQQAGYAGLMQLASGLMQGGAPSTQPGGAARGLGLGLGGFNQGYQGSINSALNQGVIGAQLAKAKREEDQQRDWLAMWGGGTPSAPGIQMASADNRLDTAAATPVGMIPPNMRPMIAKMGPEKGSAFLATLASKQMETGQWQDIGGGLQQNRLTGEKKPISNKMVDVAVNPSINMPAQEKEEAKIVGKKFGEMYVDLQNGMMTAPGRLGKLDRLESLLSKTYTGMGGEQVQQANRAMKAAGDALGLNTSALTDKVGAAEAAQALSNEMAMEMRNPQGGAGMPGAMSDADREFLKAAVGASLSTTPEGRKLVIETRRRMIKREQQVAKMARDYRKEHGSIDEGFFDKLAAFSEKTPMFDDMKLPQVAAAPTQGGGADPLGIR